MTQLIVPSMPVSSLADSDLPSVHSLTAPAVVFYNQMTSVPNLDAQFGKFSKTNTLPFVTQPSSMPLIVLLNLTLIPPQPFPFV
jgi:hypothetical protein